MQLVALLDVNAGIAVRLRVFWILRLVHVELHVKLEIPVGFLRDEAVPNRGGGEHAVREDPFGVLPLLLGNQVMALRAD